VIRDDATRDLLALYVFGDVSDAERAEVERLATEDPVVAEELASLLAARDALPFGAETAPPPELRDRVLGAAAAESKGRGRWWRGVPWSVVATAIAASLALVIAWDDQRVRRTLELERHVSRTLAEPNVVVSYQLHGTGTSAGAFGSVALDLDAKKAAVVIRELAEPPAGSTYRLWAVLDGGTAVPCGNLPVGRDGTVMRQIPIPVDAYTSPIARMLLTVEAAADAPAPTGPAAMVSS
jgi:anti-sigma-K factor RskA